MLLTLTNSCTGDHFYWVLDWTRSLGILNPKYLQFQISQDYTVWHRKVNPRNRNDSFPAHLLTGSLLFISFLLFLSLVLCFPGAHYSCLRWNVPCSLLGFSSGPFHCYAEKRHPHTFSYRFQKMGLTISIQDTYHLRKCREKKEKEVKIIQINLTSCGSSKCISGPLVFIVTNDDSCSQENSCSSQCPEC